MKIKKLEICGFKSFADRTQLVFGSGVTGVVGPNGCGKSNIIDALRWCMGEMSAKHLRGRAMQDVIFAGSDSRGPSGMAEVTLTLHNDGDVPPQYAEYEDVAVTRRLHRDGSSEYLINKIPARLRDITDLFLGTGVGTRAYSIIEQGRIGFIVSAKPEDRRTLIEEVAGITKFKARKKAAERRMSATEQNLMRVKDIVAELERQLNSLRRQAKKAERYKTLKEELRDLDLHAAAMEILRLTALEKQQRVELGTLQTQLDDGLRGVDADEAGLEADRLELLEEEQRLQAQQKEHAELEAQLAALERDLTHWKAQITEAEQRGRDAAHDVETSEERIAAIQLEREEMRTSIEELTALAEGDQAALSRSQAAVAEMQTELKALDQQIETLRRDALEHVHGAAQQRALVANLEKQKHDQTHRLESATTEKQQVEAQRAASQERHRALEERREKEMADLEQWRTRRGELETELQERLGQVRESEAKITELKETIHERRSRLESLQEIARRFEGYSDGVRALLDPDSDAEGASRPTDGIRGLVTDVLKTEPKFERAVEAALGERVQYLIVEERDTALQAIEYLKSTDGGRSGFIPVAPRHASTAELQSHLDQPGVLGAAIDYVTVEPQYRAVAEYLLANVLVVEDVNAAVSCWSGARVNTPVLVTLGGDIIDPAGTLSGGSQEGAGLLAKQREIRELTELLSDLDRQLEQSTAAHTELEQSQLQLQVNVQQLDKEIHQAEIDAAELAKDVESGAAELKRLAERFEVLSLEIQQRSEELTAIEQDTAAAMSAATEAESGQQGVEEQIAGLQSQRTEQATALEERSASLTAVKVSAASREEKLRSCRESIERLEQSEEDYKQRIERDRRTIEETGGIVTELTSQVAEGSASAQTQAAKAQEQSQALSEARAAYDTKRSGMDEITKALRERRRANELVQESLVQLKMDLQRMDLERQRLCEQIAERHDVELLTVVGDYHLRPPPAEESEQRRLELDRQLRKMGPINLTAIDECKEVEERHNFLVAQRDDLEEALDSLRRAIRRINRASRERFREAFDAVNEMFQKVYPRLFRGGEAHLKLIEADDVLEAGVDIFAQPPGKKLQSVNLMSGGEKALTATALVFAIFLIKPSPFCVLDEVDAPLDDANVGRFNEMLREMSSISQFIVITHNKTTMTEADKLYGITMEEPGMSKVVSVDLDSENEDRAA